MNTFQFYLWNWQGISPVLAITVFVFVYTGLLVWAFPQSHRFNLTYSSKASLILRFYFFCMIYPTWICFSSILPLGLFKGIICNVERLKGGPWSPELLVGNLDQRGDLIWMGGGLRPLFILWIQFHTFYYPILSIFLSIM